jgi:hypothetical protein
VRKLITSLVLLGACRSAAPTPAPAPSRTTASVDPGVGAAAPPAAVQKFMKAVEDQDLQAMSAVWGTSEGPTRDDKRLSPSELDKRELLILCYLRHDSYHILADAPATQGKRSLAVEIQRKASPRTTTFTVTLGPSNRWYVENVDLEPLRHDVSCR